MIRGKNIWIIGASEGMGRALAQKLAPSNRLALSARNKKRLDELAKSFETRLDVEVLPLDVQKAAEVTKAAEHLAKSWDQIDLVIYLAGIYDPAPLENIDVKTFEQTLDINTTGAFRVLKALQKPLFKQGFGQVAVVASVAGYHGLPKGGAYGVSKAALIHLTEILNTEWGAKGLQVQVINPGFVRTRLTDKNTFDMPFLLEPTEAADHIIKGLESGSFEVHFPKQFTFMLKSLGLLPYWLFNKVMAKVNEKGKI